MKLSTTFTRGSITSPPTATLAFVAQLMQSHNVGAVVIVDNLRPLGILTDRDLAMALGAKGMPPSTPAREVMTPHVLAIPDETDFYAATRFMKERGVRRLPIVDRNDQVVGMVTLDDLLGSIGRELGNLAECISNEVRVR
jgi:CBS domain-containing protein